MTNQEAIKILTAKVKCIQCKTSGTDINCDFHDCYNYELCYAQGAIEKQLEALNIAISLLKTQIIIDTLMPLI